jgi:hypothetical protein
MADTQRPVDPANWLEEPKKLPETLNVITILTFVGSGLALITHFYSFFRARDSYEKTLQLQDKLDQVPGWVKGFMAPDPIGTARNAMENRVPLLILNVVAALLCIYGAVQMRQLKKVGFPIYIIGELLPFAALFIFVGWLGWFALSSTIVFALVFILLYASQRKYFKN